MAVEQAIRDGSQVTSLLVVNASATTETLNVYGDASTHAMRVYVSGGSTSDALADDSQFTPGTSLVTPVGFFADETATDSVNEGDIGAARITLDRRQINASEYAEDSIFASGSYVTLAGTEIDDPTALPAMTEGDVGNLKGDLAGRIISTEGTLFAGENIPEAVLGIADKYLSSNTYTGSVAQNNSFTTLNLKTSPGVVLNINVINTTGSTRYFQIHNTATTPGGGATALRKYLIPANSQLILGPKELGANGIYCSTGIAYANSTVAATYTAGSAGDLLLDITYV